MRTSHRVFAAALSTLFLGALIAVVPFVPQAQALNGIHTISIQSLSVTEGNGGGTANLVVTASVSPSNNVPFSDISASVSTVEGTARSSGPNPDYTAVSNAPLEFPSGTDTDTFVVPISKDAFAEPNETFTFVLSNINGASAGTMGTATINNDDGTAPTFVINNATPSAAEGNVDSFRQVTVALSANAPQEITLNYATGDGSATADNSKGALDYTKITTQTLTWAAGTMDAKPIKTGADDGVQIKGDALAEPDESFFVNFGSPNNAVLGAGNPATITLLNDDGQPSDVPKLTLEAIPDKTEGDTSSSTQTVTVSIAPAPSQTVTVQYATSDGTAVKSTPDAKGDYEETKGTLTFPANVGTSKTFTVPVNGDPADEQDEIYHVTLSNPTNATLATATRDAKILNDDFGQITTVPGTGGGPHVRLFGATGSDLGGFFAIQPDAKGNVFTGGLHVARGDFFKPTKDGFVAGGDGIDEIVVGAGSFGPKSATRSFPFVRIFAVDGTQIANFLAYDQGFGGGVYVAAGNLDGDASNGDELIVAAGAGGGPHVKVLRIKGPGDNIGVLASFFAYTPGFPGGVRVAAGNMTGDAKDEIVTAPGPGGGPHVRVWSPNPDGTATPTAGFMAYGPEFAGGVFVAASKNRIVTGPGAGGGPHVRVWDGSGSAVGGTGFMAYGPEFTGGVSVALGNLDNNPDAEVITSPGAGGGPHVRIFGEDGSLPFGTGFFAYDPNFHGGVEVAVSTGA